MSNRAGALTAEQFVEKWSKAQLSERAASQEHFLDLCHLLGQPTPAEADATGADYCFEKRVKVVGSASRGAKGDYGFADVWKRGFFAWEYKGKGKHKTLDEAYRQLYQYRDDLDNPKLSVVCDIRTTEIRAHFPDYPTEKTVVRLEEIPGRLEVLRRVFTRPDSFKPGKTREEMTSDLAETFGDLADRLLSRVKAVAPSLFHGAGDPVAHFLMKVMFCLFAEDVGLLPDKLFTKLVDRCRFDPESFQPSCAELFERMKKGGWYGNDRIPHFNGGLFDDDPPLALNSAELPVLARAAERGWAAVEPSIFGTLFERILDPRKRAQIGAHYTSRNDILLVVEPVVMTPLRRRWAAVQEQIAPQLKEVAAEKDAKKRDVLSAPVRVALDGFRRHLGAQRILDPACGSGNFLYVALQQLLDLDDEVVRFAARYDIALNPLPYVETKQLHGIEINPYAAELAQVVVWIGYLQWLAEHRIDNPKRPILDKLQTIENRDAIIDLSKPNLPTPAKWPEADFIIGNPPFLGSKQFRKSGLSDDYIAAMYAAFGDAKGQPLLARTSDLCCYWFELACRKVTANRGRGLRIGLLATQRIRGPANRAVLQGIKAAGDIFLAWSDKDWVLDGASVHTSIVGFDDGSETERFLDGRAVERINADLTSGDDFAAASKLKENKRIAFMGDTKGASFDVTLADARKLLASPNPNGLPNTDVVKRWINGDEYNDRPLGTFIIDFGCETSLADAAMYEQPFEWVEKHVRGEVRGDDGKDKAYWWLHERPRPDMRRNLPASRYIVTANVAKFSMFGFLSGDFLPDHQLIVFARDDDYFFGVLHSAVHELWARRKGGQLREVESGFRYQPTEIVIV